MYYHDKTINCTTFYSDDNIVQRLKAKLALCIVSSIADMKDGAL